MNRSKQSRNRFLVCAVAFGFLGVFIGSLSSFESRPAEFEVRTVLEQQVREWNAGNLAGFMETYAKSDQTRFASGGDISLGWQTVFDRYRKKYGDRAAM